MTDGYEVLDETEQFRSPVFRVVTDKIRMPDGEVAKRDYLVHIGAVGVVAVDQDSRVVLVRQYRAALRRDLWELPAGLVDVDGESLVAAAARELAEEADLAATRWDLLAEVHTSPGCSNELIRVFLARGLSPVPHDERYTRTHEEAGLVLKWFDLDEAVDMVLGGEITNAACAVGVLAAARAKRDGWRTVRPAEAAARA